MTKDHGDPFAIMVKDLPGPKLSNIQLTYAGTLLNIHGHEWWWAAMQEVKYAKA